MSKKIWGIAITVLALLPSMWSIWHVGGLPHTGHFHDDGIYLGTAASLAEGRGLRVESLPGEPYQVKYPPLFPLYLTPGVGNEWVLAMLIWILLPVLLYELWRWRGDPWMVLLVGWNVNSVMFSSTPLSEILTTLLAVLSVRLLESDRVRAAGFVAGLAYLTRTAMIALPVGALLWLLWRRRWRDACIFGGMFAPCFAGWTIFVGTHTVTDLKRGWAYYISYAQVFRESFSWELFPIILSTNVKAVIASWGGILFFDSGSSFWEGNFARLLLLASVSGLVRQWRKEGPTPYLLMAMVYLPLIVAWNFIPNERFMYPILPLILSGLLTEARHLWQMLGDTWVKQRGATVVIGAVVAAGAVWMVERNLFAAWHCGPVIAEQNREFGPDRENVYEWIRSNTPPDANFIVYDDPALRRRTGRHGFGIHCPSRFVYVYNSKAILEYHDSFVRAMPSENYQYVMMAPNGLAPEIRPKDQEKILADWKTRTDLETVYQNDHYMIRRVRQVQSGL